jgi:hypothetical protein
MPRLEYFTHAPQPAPETPVWRFRPLNYFRDIVRTSEFHFTRADRFPQDDEEGIPAEEYIAAVRQLDPFAFSSVRRCSAIRSPTVPASSFSTKLQETAERMTSDAAPLTLTEDRKN